MLYQLNQIGDAVTENLWARLMRTHINTVIAMSTKRLIPHHFVMRIYRERLSRTARYTISTMVAVIDRMGVMAVFAVEVTPLQKDDQAIARSIYAGKIQNATDKCAFLIHTVSYTR
ncbi:hypothetical protein VIBR0546_06662 [Vibrio brasiliensis LMG 20546]|uniref:Uncharacterized protein n=1 Tax=Vibrio brasiliensis LMG 20546 TaxID=945543 RepID=E8LYV4_9VIBR|nr:hypothetical protein VIBR0546_06662 [Vibrio brasiliensis LMG 20546]